MAEKFVRLIKLHRYANFQLSSLNYSLTRKLTNLEKSFHFSFKFNFNLFLYEILSSESNSFIQMLPRKKLRFFFFYYKVADRSIKKMPLLFSLNSEKATRMPETSQDKFIILISVILEMPICTLS